MSEVEERLSSLEDKAEKPVQSVIQNVKLKKNKKKKHPHE